MNNTKSRQLYLRKYNKGVHDVPRDEQRDDHPIDIFHDSAALQVSVFA